jgi:hypothetical protein
MFPGSTPKLYGQWLSEVVDRTARRHPGEERILFINAWNEWAEGNHLEPDMKWGLQYLEATREALAGQAAADPVRYLAGMARAPSMKAQV